MTRKIILCLLSLLWIFLPACTTDTALPTPSNTPQPSPQTPTATTPPLAADPTDLHFTAVPQNLGTPTSFDIKLADMDLDSDLDIFITDYNGPSKLWLNDGTGHFTNSGQSFGNTPRAHGVALEDFNGDGAPDIFLVYHDHPSEVYFNDGTGQFNSQQELDTANGDPESILIGDIDADGDIDAFLVYARAENRLWLNDGPGTFTRAEAGYGGNLANGMLVEDFNGDNLPDLLYCFVDQPAEIWLNDGTGNFPTVHQSLSGTDGCHVSHSLHSGDIEGDGDQDIAIASRNGASIWLNDQNTGTFSQSGPTFYPGSIKVKLFDIDLDGDLDLLSAHVEDGNTVWIYENGSYNKVDSPLGSVLASAIAIGDLDSDQDIDVIIASAAQTSHVTVYLND